jgi:hypothetical protein
MAKNGRWSDGTTIKMDGSRGWRQAASHVQPIVNPNPGDSPYAHDAMKDPAAARMLR